MDHAAFVSGRLRFVAREAALELRDRRAFVEISSPVFGGPPLDRSLSALCRANSFGLPPFKGRRRFFSDSWLNPAKAAKPAKADFHCSEISNLSRFSIVAFTLFARPERTRIEFAERCHSCLPKIRHTS
jgi:hypothetical protein